MVNYNPSLSLPLIIDKLASLIPHYPQGISYNTIHLVTHIPTQVSIDCDTDGYYLLAPTSYANPIPTPDQTPFYDYVAGDFSRATTNLKAIALGWLLTVIEHAAIQALES